MTLTGFKRVGAISLSLYSPCISCSGVTWYLNKSHQSGIVFNFSLSWSSSGSSVISRKVMGIRVPNAWAMPHLDDTSEKFLFVSLTESIYTWPVVALKLCYSRVVVQYSRYLKLCNRWNPDVSPVFRTVVDIWYLGIGAKRVSLEGTWMWPYILYIIYIILYIYITYILWEYDYNVLCF